MRILLIAMPDTVPIVHAHVECPNLGIISLAGNLPRHEVRCLDLVGCRQIGKTLRETIGQFKPRLIGLSAMTFQFSTLLRTAAFIKRIDTGIMMVAGGYHVTPLYRELTEEQEFPLDFLVRGEGEMTLRELADTIEAGTGQYHAIQGLSYKTGDQTWNHNPERGLTPLDAIQVPDRSVRIRDSLKIFGIPWDALETSRGCTCSCKFCSITNMYGKSFRKYPMARIEKDWQGMTPDKKAMFIVDDNIGLDKEHLLEVCDLLTSLNRRGPSRTALVQLSAQSIVRLADSVDRLKKAGIDTVFVGFETMDKNALENMAKSSNPSTNREAARILRANRIAIIGGCIFGFPDDDADTVRNTFREMVDLRPDIVYPQFMTPYPGTELRKEMLTAGLVHSDDYRCYDGYTCTVKTNKLSNQELRKALHKEMFKSYFQPKLIWGNQIVKHFPQSVSAFLTNLVDVSINLIKDRDFPRQNFDF